MEKLQRFSIRKLSIGAVSCLIGTVSFLSYSHNVQAAENFQTVETAKAENEIQPEKAQESKPNEEAKGGVQNAVVDKNTVGSQANDAAVINTSDQSKLEDSSAVASISERNQLQASQDSSIKVKENNLNNNKRETTKAVVQPTSLNDENNLRDPDSKDVEVKPKESSDANTQSTATTSGVQPFVNLAVESDNKDLTPEHETINSQWTIHYVNQADHKKELKDPTVITMQYTRTNTPQSDGKIQYGDWSYVPDSFKQTGTPITVKDSNNPVKQDNVDKNGENFDIFTITAMYPTITGYDFHNGINGTRLRDNLRTNERQADTMNKDFYAEYDVAKQPDVAKPTQETVGSQWRIHYIDSTNHEHELKAPTVINLQYARTNTPQSDGTIQHGDWSYVSGSFKQTGTQITVKDSDNPVKQDNMDKNGKNYDIFTITAMYPTIAGYNFHDGINNMRFNDYLLNYDPNGNIQMPTMGRDFYVEYDPISKRSVAVKFVDDQSYDFNTSDHKKQVGQAVTVTGRDGDTVNLNLTVPDKYQLADGQQLPTTYTFAKGSGDLKIHLVHKVVQREAAIDVKLGLITDVRTKGDDDDDAIQQTVTQTRWKQLGDDAEHLNGFLGALPVVGVGTLTGHVNYDLVDETVVSLKDDWTSLNLSGHSYQLPNGTEVVNGIRVDGDTVMGKKLRDDWYLNWYRKWHHDVDPDYITRPWYRYLSVNETNNERNSGFGMLSDALQEGLQAGLVGDEPNALAKAIGDRAATSVEMSNKPIDLNLLQGYDFNFSEQNGQLRAKALLPVGGVYIPYVEKTATRTINVTTPDGKTTTVKQTATLAKQIDFGKDAHPDWTTGEWSSYEVPTIPGYTASQSNVAKTAVTGTTEDQTVNITYTANPQTSTVVYQTEDGTSVHTTTVNGHTGQTVKVSNEVPVGWHIVNGTVPSEITFGPDGAPKTVVTIAHSHATVTPDAPKTTGDKLPDNPDKAYPAGVGETDLNKTVTRTIKVTTPDGQTKTVAQTAKLTRTADVDEVTGEVKYGDWSTGQWDAYKVPTVAGYTATQTDVAATSVDEHATDQTVDVSYVPNKQTTTIRYVDDKGEVIHTTTVDGVTNQTVKVPSEVPAGWMITKGTVPSELTFGTDGRDPIEVTVAHQHVTVTPDHPQDNGTKLPDNPAKIFNGVEANDLNKTITRTIKVTTPDEQTKTVVQTAKLTRTADVDEVTGEVAYGNWTTGEWAAYDVPSVAGYVPSQSKVDKNTVTAASKDTTTMITYTPMQHQISVEYVDDDDHGKVVKTDQVPGKTDRTITVMPTAPANYDLVDNGNRTYTVTSGDGQRVQIHVKHHQVTTSESKTVTRTINIDAPHDGTTVFKQAVDLSRDVTTDQVTGDKTYGDWSTTEWTHYDVPAVAGYTPSIKQVAQQVVDGTTKDQTVNVTYTANAQTTHVNYVDGNGNAVHTTTVTGKTDQTVKVPNETPAGWKVVGEAVPTEITFGPDGHADVSVTVDHQHVTVTPDQPKTPADKLPNNPGKTYPDGVGHNDLNRTVTRTIKVVTPDGQTNTVAQTVKLTRTANVDEVTGKVTYGKWTTGEWSRYEVPSVPGYTPSQSYVPAVNVTDTTKDQMLILTYTANDGTQTIVYQDEDGSEVGKQVVHGKTDEKVKVTPDVPDGYVIKGEVPSEVTIKPDDTPITVTVEHGKSHVTPDKPVNKGDLIPDTKDKHYPEGLTHNDLNKTVTRKITITDPTGKKTTSAQTVTFTRGATVDEVTNKVTYDDWSENGKHTFDKVDVPNVPGYTASGEVSSIAVTPETQSSKVDITYTANAQTATITYIDDTTSKKLHTDKLDGVSDQDAKYATGNIIKQYEDQHYKLVSDSTNGKDLIFDHDDNADQTYEVHFVHGSHTINQTTSPKQTVHYVYADDLARHGTAANDNVQQLSFTRDGYNDEVTGIDHWNAWTPANSQYEAVDSPVIQGYTPNKSVIEKSTVNPTDKDTEITIVYNADKQAARVIYVDKTTNTTLTSNNLSGKSDKDSRYNTKDTIDKYLSQHYVLTGDETNGNNVIFDHDDQQDQTYYVYLVHGTQKVNRQDQVIETIDYKFEDGKTAQPTVIQTKYFSEDGIKDKVTGQITWTPADSQKFDDVATKSISGYTPDKDNVTGSTVKFGDSDIEVTVTYHNNAQKAVITYIDDTAKKTLASDSQNGKFDHEIAFSHKPSDVISGFEKAGYKLVSNNFKDGTKYKADNSKNVFYVHFVHGSHDISDKKAITETITYKMSDGSKAPDKVEKQVEFSRVGKHDEVTNTDTWNEWQPNKQSFSMVPTPDVTGYTPNTKLVEAKTVTAGDKDINETIIYTPDKQKAKVVFIDDTDKKTLDTHDLTGVTNSHEKYSPSEEIEKFIHDNYVFVSSDYPEKGFTYDNDDNHDQIFEVHLKERPTESDTPTIPGNTEDNGGSNDTPTDSDEPEKDNGGSDTVDKSSHKTPVKRNSNKKHHDTKKTNKQKNANKKHQSTQKINNQKNAKTAKLNPNKVNVKTNKLTQTKLGKVQESTNNELPQTGEKHSNLMAMLGLAISSLGMIGTMKSKKRKDN